MRHGAFEPFRVGIQRGSKVDGACVGHGVNKNLAVALRHTSALNSIWRTKKMVHHRRHVAAPLLPASEHGLCDWRQHYDLLRAREKYSIPVCILGDVLRQTVAPAVDDNNVRAYCCISSSLHLAVAHEDLVRETVEALY